MLIRFRVKNFLSFNEMVEFSTIGGKVRNKDEHLEKSKDLKLLRFAAIFGANASGKSNIVMGMETAQELLISQSPPLSSNKYCRILEDNKYTATYFEFEILLNGKYYAYGFEIILSKGIFSSEWLVELFPNDTEKVLFERNLASNTLEFGQKIKNDPSYKILKIFGNEIKNNKKILFLSEMNRNKDEFYKTSKEASVFKKIYSWFVNSLDINYPDMPISPYSYFTSKLKYEEVKSIISSFGTGITDYNMKDIELSQILHSGVPKELINTIIAGLHDQQKGEKEEAHITSMLRGNKNIFFFEKNGNEVLFKTIEFTHENCDVSFSISEESDGTRRLLDLIEIILSARNKRKKTFIIDEIDRSLHPQLTYRFIELFLEESVHSSVQLIVTTHEARLMDFNLLRRDEIWLVDKNQKGESSLYSLDAFNIRFDQKVDKAYLDGRYGGVPLFT